MGAKVQQTLSDLFHVSPATYTLSMNNNAFARKIAGKQVQVLEQIKMAPVKHVDESGFRIGGRTSWLHVLSTQTATHYRVSEKRKDLEPLQGMSGVLVHDHLKSYFQVQGVEHALCNAHHLRELKAMIEIDKEGWAARLDRLLRAAGSMTNIPVDCLSELYDNIVAEGLAFHAKLVPLNAASRKRRPGHNLLLRLQGFKEAVLRFATNSAVPFTNNLAEQDIRMMKVKQKISGGFRYGWR